jgi:hypothetical protein
VIAWRHERRRGGASAYVDPIQRRDGRLSQISTRVIRALKHVCKEAKPFPLYPETGFCPFVSQDCQLLGSIGIIHQGVHLDLIMANLDWESMLPNLSNELEPTTMLSRRMRGGYSDVYESSWRGKRVINHYYFLLCAEWSITY